MTLGKGNGPVVDCQSKTLHFAGQIFPCSIGKGGPCAASDKREGDGCTPLGIWPIRAVLLRPQRVNADFADTVQLPWRWTRPNDGWSDDIADAAYNRPVILPHPLSHEVLQRADAAYDIIIVLGHNDDPPVAAKGSAIFWHIWVPDDLGTPKPTEGCIAIAREDMDLILPQLHTGMVIEIK